MAKLLPDVSFPLFGGDSTLPLRDRLPLRLIELSGCTIDGRWSRPDLAAPHWRLYCNLDDGAEIWVRGRNTPLRAGHLYAVPAWLHWRAHCRGPVRHFNAMIDLPSLPRDRVAALADHVLLLAKPDDELARAWLALAADSSRARQEDPVLLARGHAVVWAAMVRAFALLPDHGIDLLTPIRDRGIIALCRWIDDRLDQRLSRPALARAARCSEAELARRFRRSLGTSPVRWLRDRRVARAAEWLRASDESIESIAARCGFSDRSQFSRLFSRSFGCGPATYRRRS